MFFTSLQPKPIIFAPMPKSASNTLLRRMESVLNCDIITPKSGGGIGHFILDRRQLLRASKTIYSRKTPLIYQHFLPTEHNRQSLLKYTHSKATPRIIVSLRNIYDVSVSCADHQRKGGGPWWITKDETNFFSPENADQHSHMWNALICLKFYTAWSIAARSGLWDVLFVDYQDITGAPEKCLQNISQFYEIPFDTLDKDALSQISHNVNIGTSSRGALLDPVYKDQLKAFASTFTDIDFKPIGL